MTKSNYEMLRHITRQNNLIIRRLGMVLDVAGFTLERTFDMADDIETVIADVAKQTEVSEGTAVVIDHAVSLLDDIGEKLKAAGTDPAKLKALHESITTSSQKLDAKKGELGAAVERNTTSEPSAA